MLQLNLISRRAQALREQEIALTAHICQKRGAIIVKKHSSGTAFGIRMHGVHETTTEEIQHENEASKVQGSKPKVNRDPSEGVNYRAQDAVKNPHARYYFLGILPVVERLGRVNVMA